MPTPTVSSNYQFVDDYHLWLFVWAFLFITFLAVSSLVIRCTLQFLEDTHRAIYEFKEHCAENKGRYERTLEK